MPRIDNELLAILRADSRGISRRALIVVMRCRHRGDILLCRQMPGLADEALARLEAHSLVRSANARSGRNGCGRLETWYAIRPEDDEEIGVTADAVPPEEEIGTAGTAILHALRQAGERGKTRIEIHNLFKHKYSTPDLQQALERLAAGGEARCVRTQRPRGRPRERWYATQHVQIQNKL